LDTQEMIMMIMNAATGKGPVVGKGPHGGGAQTEQHFYAIRTITSEGHRRCWTRGTSGSGTEVDAFGDLTHVLCSVVPLSKPCEPNGWWVKVGVGFK
jgi:hypothetical protein